MPFSLTADEGFLRVIGSGEVTGDELQRLYSELSDAAERNNKCLLDFSSASFATLTPSTVRHLAELPPRFRRLAIVVERGAGYALARSYQASAGAGRAVGVFMAADNALAWLRKR